MLEFKKSRIILIVSASIVVILVLFAVLRDNSQSITLAEATQILQDRSVKKVVATNEYVYLKTDDGFYKIASSQVSPQMFTDYKVEVGGESNFLVYILFLVVFLGLGSIVFRYLQKRDGLTITKDGISRDISAKPDVSAPIEAIRCQVSFDDIGGISDVKIELEEIIDFMRNPKRYKSFGARLPRGVLLVGPPGVGKTMIAKAVANAAAVPFYYQSGASFVQIYVGMGAKRVHELFAAAKKNAPSIIFIDEIDAVGKKRDGQRNDEREATLNQLLTEMDGFEASSSVIVIAATNNMGVLDPALLRAGRFDRRIFVELPTKRERSSILEKYLAKIPHQVQIEQVAEMTVGFNGAALAALVNEAALLALRQNAFQVNLDHFYQVKDKVMFGKKKLQMLNDKQRSYLVSYQAGKALVATYFDLPFEKLMLSNEKLLPVSNDAFLQQDLEAQVKMHLSGLVTCDLKYKQHASSAKQDLDEAKEIVKKMCREYGMSHSIITNEEE
ncbi:MAG: ATP-dependent metallopeptidase FtsH/Yme1/Tma family protein, partial [Campylobacterales bacterium]|nr:ATP-dependent metallopeptidase FtsH/Yme1/Tma family protein [Campylobacterales bacterium]